MVGDLFLLSPKARKSECRVVLRDSRADEKNVSFEIVGFTDASRLSHTQIYLAHCPSTDITESE